MARLTRVHQKVFASNASNNGVFGSLQAGNPTTSSDVATLQSLSAFENGWDDAAYSGDKLPPLEEFQGIQYGISYQQAYMLQEGIAEWEASTPYYKGSLAKTISGSSFKLYCSLADNNVNNAVSNTTYWKLVMDSDDTYAFDNTVVHLSGTETIPGAKTFGSNITIYKDNARLLCDDSSATWQTDPGTSSSTNGIEFRDSAHYWGGIIEIAKYTDGRRNLRISLRGKSSDTNHYFDFFVGSNGSAYCDADSGYKSSIVGWTAPNYSAGVALTNNSDYQCPSNGYIVFSGLCNLSVNSTVTINGSVVMTYNYNSGHHNLISDCIPVSAGDTVKVNITYTNNGITFYPAKGG